MRARRRDRTTAATPLSLDVPSTGGRHQRHVELIDSDSAVTFPIMGAVTTPRLSSMIFSVMLRTTEKILFIMTPRGFQTVTDNPRIDSIDEPAIRAFRADRIRRELRRQNREAVLVVDPVNLRYATGTRNMQVWTMHNIVRYALVFTHGPTVLFELPTGRHLSAGLESLSDIRPSIPFDYMLVAENAESMARRWAVQIRETLREHGCGTDILAADRDGPLMGRREQGWWTGRRCWSTQEPSSRPRKSSRSGLRLPPASRAFVHCTNSPSPEPGSPKPSATSSARVWPVAASIPKRACSPAEHARTRGFRKHPIASSRRETCFPSTPT